MADDQYPTVQQLWRNTAQSAWKYQERACCNAKKKYDPTKPQACSAGQAFTTFSPAVLLLALIVMIRELF
jgi:hypothetical protein